MRRSTRSSLLSTVASLPAADVRRLSHRLMWLVLALAVGLGALAGADRSAVAQGDGYEMRTFVATCEIVPPLPPTLNEAGCAPVLGAYVEFVAEDGTVLGGCTTNEVNPSGQLAGCSVIVPFNTKGQAVLDVSTIVPGYAPRQNPIYFTSPGPGPVDGIVGTPIFVNLPTGGGGGEAVQPEQPAQTDQNQPVEQPQQAAPADRHAFIISGTCAEPGETLDGRIDVYIPQGDPIGLPTAIVAESGGGSIAVALDDLFASPHAVMVVTPSDGQGTNVACGDLGTVADDDGIAVIGLHPAQGSEIGGIAYLATDPSTGQTLLSIFLAAGLG